MSTSVDNEGRPPRLTAAESRARILSAARAAFTRAGYDAVGVREIAALASVDPAMVPRLFGSKEALFTTIADKAFGLEPAFEGPIEGMGRRVAHHLMGPIERRDPDDFDEFAFLLRSVGSPTAAPILSAAMHTTFIEPLSQRMSGPAAEARAALATAYVMGFAVLRAGLGSPSIEAADQDMIIERLGDAIQACLTP
ncbi:TetR family transcriptional regulator [Rhizobium sp. NPDC090279]|uniref:TetR/AcrR family transcriptional regulator n=1 Tax=Rhizobium sp. NPDC090279 TaxID=3364499 RepID=UPI00383B239A